MTLRLLSALALVVWLFGIGSAAQTSVLPIDEVTPGMVGIGRTVFEGARLEEFRVHILGVLRNVIGPKRNLVLAKLEGGPLAQTGVIAGMSGSPVYVDGRLLGAVSYALGQFSKEPIAGITPIGEMTDAAALAPAGVSSAPGTRPVALAWPATPAELFAIWNRDLGRPPISLEGQSAMVGGSPDLSALGAMLRPIAVPLVSAGLAPETLAPIAPALAARGWLPVAAPTGGAPPDAPSTPRALRPGDAVGVSLLGGDFMLGATGTVTHVDGDQVFAFGHPMYNLGPTQFPMTQADVHVVLPSLLQSSKIASLGPVIGTVQQDRATAIAGRLGQGPSMIPMSVALNSERSGSRAFSFSVVRDETFTPLLTYLAVANVLTSYERGVGPASYTVRGKASVAGRDAIVFEDIFAGDQAAGVAAAYIATPLTVLLKNAAERVEVADLSITIGANEDARTARIERVWLDTSRPRAGRPATVNVLLRSHTGDEMVKRIPIDIPSNATGSLQLLVSDAARMAQDDRRDLRGAESQRVDTLIRTLNRARRNNRIYVRLSAPAGGAVIGGEPMAGLPPSVLSVMEADRSSNVGSLRSATRGEWELATDLAVSGARTLNVNLDRPE